MLVTVFFVQPDGRTQKTPLYHIYGKYNICGFMFVDNFNVRAFSTHAGQVYTQFSCSQRDPPGHTEGHTDFLMLSIDQEEISRLLSTCEACAAIKKPFNLRDIVLMYAPFREVEDLPVEHAPTLNNAQAMIVMLRSCLCPDNSLRQALDGLHSRQTLIETLYDHLVASNQTVPVTWSSISKLVQWPSK